MPLIETNTYVPKNHDYSDNAKKMVITPGRIEEF